jgi:hypothetical protein
MSRWGPAKGLEYIATAQVAREFTKQMERAEGNIHIRHESNQGVEVLVNTVQTASSAPNTNFKLCPVANIFELW